MCWDHRWNTQENEKWCQKDSMNEREKKWYKRNLGWTRTPRCIQIQDIERCFQEVKGNERNLGLRTNTTGKSDHNIAREAVQVKNGEGRWPGYSGQLIIFSGSWTMALKQAIMFNIALWQGNVLYSFLERMRFSLPAQDKATLPLHVVGMELNLNCILDVPIKVSQFSIL